MHIAHRSALRILFGLRHLLSVHLSGSFFGSRISDGIRVDSGLPVVWRTVGMLKEPEPAPALANCSSNILINLLYWKISKYQVVASYCNSIATYNRIDFWPRAGSKHYTFNVVLEMTSDAETTQSSNILETPSSPPKLLLDVMLFIQLNRSLSCSLAPDHRLCRSAAVSTVHHLQKQLPRKTLVSPYSAATSS